MGVIIFLWGSDFDRNRGGGGDAGEKDPPLPPHLTRAIPTALLLAPSLALVPHQNRYVENTDRNSSHFAAD